MDLTSLEVKIIADAGDSQSYSMEAIKYAKQGNFEEAETKLQQAKEASLKAHKSHTELMTESINQGNPGVDFLGVHASNHMSTAEMLINMAELFIFSLKEARK